jgi:hypothetical protein
VLRKLVILRPLHKNMGGQNLLQRKKVARYLYKLRHLYTMPYNDGLQQ